MDSEAPRTRTRGSAKRAMAHAMIAPRISETDVIVPSARSARSTSRAPRLLDIRDTPPEPISRAKAMTTIWMGKAEKTAAMP